MSKRKPEIIISKMGPYVAVDVQRMVFSDGDKVEELEVKPVMVLCRCGESRCQPYCDGSHVGAGFEPIYAPETADVNVKRYVGQNITVTFNPCVCNHSGICVTTLPKVFCKANRPWIQPDSATVKELVELIDQCPSGALGYELAGHKCDCLEREALIVVEASGPFNVVGGILIKDERQTCPYNAEHYSLCRCGKSERAPYCDGSHNKIKTMGNLENW